jgi:LacI family transcriptional regulator
MLPTTSMKKVRISQQQIARDLGLSQTLVSMVLNGRRKGVSEESYQQIWDHARRVGYQPKGMSPELLQGAQPETATVGFILRSGLKLYSQSPFFGHVQHGLHDFLAGSGISLVFLGTEDHLDVKQLKELYGDRKVFRGLVVFGEVTRPFLHALKQLEPRIVSVSAQYPGLCHSVVYNEEQAAELLVQHLTDLGHREFAWLGGSRGMQRAKRRLEATMSALRLRNLALQPRFTAEVDGAERLEGRQAAEMIIKAAGKRHRPTAWICYNGTMARGAVNYLLQQGVKIPDDLSVATFDRTRLCEEEHPTLTGASVAPEELGRVAGEVLLKSSGEAKEMFADMVLASELIPRESTGVRPGK